MVLREWMLSPVSMVTKEKELQRQSGITDERNTQKYCWAVLFCSPCSPGTTEVTHLRISCWKAGSSSIEEISLTPSFCIEAISLELGSQKTEETIWAIAVEDLVRGNILMPVTVMQVGWVTRAQMDKNNTEIVREKIVGEGFLAKI